jgi:hypothetical protein
MSQTKVEAPFVENNLPFRNIIHNGNFYVHQRAQNQQVTTQILSVIDRWSVATTVNSFDATWSQSTTVPTGQGFTNSLKCDVGTAVTPSGGANYAARQSIEGKNLQHLKFGTSSAESLTLSFWVRSNKTGTYCVQFRGNDTGKSCVVDYTISSADTWEKKTMTISGDTASAWDNDVNSSLECLWHLAVGPDDQVTPSSSWGVASNLFRASSNQINFMDSTSNEWYLTGVQLEIGTQATDFEHLPFDVQLQRCERYLQKWLADDAYDSVANGAAWNDTSFICEYRFSTPMREEPTLTTNGTFIASMTGNDRSASSITLNRTTKENIQIVMTIPDNNETGTPGFFRDGNDGDSYLLFSADLL